MVVQLRCSIKSGFNYMTKCLIQIPENLVDQRYQLRIQGTGAMAFENTTQLSYETKSHSIFIQTDKAIYKPGQTSTYSFFPSLLPFVIPVFFIKKKITVRPLSSLYYSYNCLLFLSCSFFISYNSSYSSFRLFMSLFVAFYHMPYSFNRPSTFHSFSMFPLYFSSF